ncbi:MAG: HAD-IB family phosphatase [Ignavibacteriae bacterium]|nr:HAD-IB family phosphatase [Ignavibacteriota bacterium]
MAKKDYKLKIFCDFDGTVAKNDVWVSAIGKFVKDKEAFDKLSDDFCSLTLNAKDCNRMSLELVEDFTLEQFDRYLDEEDIDPHFKDFVEYVRSEEDEIFIVSGGLDYYIDYVLKKEGLDVKYFGTQLTTTPIEGTDYIKPGVEFPYADENCEKCEISKRNILINNTNDLYDEVSVFVGDGISDYCVVHYADIVFAKKRLASYCWKNNITYFEFDDFSDVKKKLVKLKMENKIKHRQFAKTNRKDVLLGG